MATATLDPHPTFNMGRVINRMAATIGRNLVPFALLASAPNKRRTLGFRTLLLL